MTDSSNRTDTIDPLLKDLITKSKTREDFNRTVDPDVSNKIYTQLMGTLALPVIPSATTGTITGATISSSTAALLTAKNIIIAAAIISGGGIAYFFNTNNDSYNPSDSSVPEYQESTENTTEVDSILPSVTAFSSLLNNNDSESEVEKDTDKAVFTEKSKPLTKPSSAYGVQSKVLEERQLIEKAREFLYSKAPNETLRILQQHKKQYPKGSFSEERDALYILALNATGQKEQAVKHSEKFMTKYPSSMFKEVVSKSIENKK